MSAWTPALDTLARPAQQAPARRRRWRAWIFLLLLGAGLAALLVAEAKTSWLQAKLLSSAARQLTFAVEPGPSPTGLPPAAAGPYDTRLGYHHLPTAVARLERAGYEITGQARWSDTMHRMSAAGLFPVYREKAQAGLLLSGNRDQPLFVSRYPQRAYETFEDIPPLVVNSLLFIENREMLDPAAPNRNPAVEWDRLAKAVVDSTLSRVTDHQMSGGSTLATQLEKVRHSPNGRTASPAEKLRQMISASLRAYQDGEHTVNTRKRIVADYLNSVPLSSAPGFGEVHGLGDAMWVWYGADFASANQLLLRLDRSPAQALAYRQVLGLLLAVNRPSYYLRNPEALDARVDTYLSLLAGQGLISAELRDLALAARPELRKTPPPRRPVPFAERKAIDTIRGELVSLLGLESVYQLDRLDLDVRTTIDGPGTYRLSKALQDLAQPGAAAAAGLAGRQLLVAGKESSVLYTFTLYEHTAGRNELRLQVDNYNQPLNMSESTRLELGSTAKLRTLATYLEVIAELHARLAKGETLEPTDPLTAWTLETYRTEPSLPGLLEAAMNRVYGAWPELFFTGGGQHSFANFNASDNGRAIPVREAFHNSVNLVFVRMMRDLVQFHMAQRDTPSPLVDAETRTQYLERFVERESREFFNRYWRKYRGQEPEQMLATLLATGRWTPRRATAAYRAARPRAAFDAYAAWIQRAFPGLAPEIPGLLWDKFDPEKLDWNDRGYLANVHPIEVWLLDYLHAHPKATRDEALEASAAMRHASYRWLMRSRNVAGQNLRIRTLMEEEAFDEIHARWKRQGYPFATLVPSLGTALGSSGDTPAALAELAGIILNGGLRYPAVRVTNLHFGAGTPFETELRRRNSEAERVFAPQVAAVLRQAMVGVVESGTARGAFQAIRTRNNEFLTIGGKTGTGDNRLEQYAPGGVLLKSTVMSRTATFVFTIGDRYFGTLVAYVPGPEAAQFDFTSALPVQIFKMLAPSLTPLLDPAIERVPPARLPRVAGNVQIGR